MLSNVVPILPTTQPPLFESPEPASSSASSSSSTSNYASIRDPEKPANDRHDTFDSDETRVETTPRESQSQESEAGETEVIEFVDPDDDVEANSGDRDPKPNAWHRFRRATGFDSPKKGHGQDPSCIDWHPQGYPMLAAMLNSDENFLLCRRYGFLHNRVLLYRQDELRELESQLHALDRQDDRDPENKRCLRSRMLDDATNGMERAKLIQLIDEKLKEYDDAVIRTRQMASLPQATHRNFTSVTHWIRNHDPLCDAENQFQTAAPDLVALVDPKEGGWFDAILEDFFLPLLPDRMAKLAFSDPAQRRSTSAKETRLYSKHRIDTFARILITIVAVALLMAPVVVLFMQDESGTVKILVILAFTLVFSAALSVFTKARRHEVFAATAA
ncbi:hypothetical protein IWZ00DRAFT_502061 [Phyllosticta capitalensis]